MSKPSNSYLLGVHVDNQRENATKAAAALAALDPAVRAAVIRYGVSPKVDRAIDGYRDRLGSSLSRAS